MQCKKFIFLQLVSFVAIFAGCASGYKDYYRPAQGATPEAIAANRLSKAPATPTVERSSPEDPQRVIDAYSKRGYAMIGSSLFNSGRPESEDAAVRQGQEVGADLVLILNARYTGSVTSSVPISAPTTSTSVSTGTATAYGPGGPVTAYGNGTTTTYSSNTTYVPMTVHRSDYGAIFFFKQRFGLGVFTRDLNDSERQQLQSNKGVVTRIVVDNTPAFEADILVGDVITQIDGVSVSNVKAFNELVSERRGKLLLISMLRNGQRIEKSVRVNP